MKQAGLDTTKTPHPTNPTSLSTNASTEMSADLVRPRPAIHSNGQPSPSLNAFLDILRQGVTPQQFETWFATIRLEESELGVSILVRNSFVKEWIQDYYREALLDALSQCYGHDTTLRVEIDANLSAPPTIEFDERVPLGGANGDPMLPLPTSRSISGPSNQQPGVPSGRLSPYSDTILHDDYTFENFVVGSSNRFAHAAAVAVAEAPAKSYNPYFLHGSVGMGKTHLLQAVCHQILRNSPRSNILYLSCESFINHFILALENGDLTSFRNKYRNVDVLLVDDIQLLANKERTQEEFFHTFNTLYNLGHQIVLSSDAPPKDIPTLQERLVSRFKMGLVVEIAPPDFETRVNILRRKARFRDQELPDDVTHYLAEQVATNIRELEGCVVRVLAFASLMDRPVDMDLAREVMIDSAPKRNSAVTIHDIISVVTRYFNVKLSDLQSKRRTQSIAYPRQICMFLARAHTNLSLEEIGGFFGGRDHTTVLYATDKIKKSIERDKGQDDLIRRLEREIVTAT